MISLCVHATRRAHTKVSVSASTSTSLTHSVWQYDDIMVSFMHSM
jgi:hypothetical protein